MNFHEAITLYKHASFNYHGYYTNNLEKTAARIPNAVVRNVRGVQAHPRVKGVFDYLRNPRAQEAVNYADPNAGRGIGNWLKTNVLPRNLQPVNQGRLSQSGHSMYLGRDGQSMLRSNRTPDFYRQQDRFRQGALIGGSGLLGGLAGGGIYAASRSTPSPQRDFISS